MTIKFENISKAYAGKCVLDDVSFEIASREFFVLVGSSGGGKTTLLKMINRLIEPTAGQVLIDDEPVQKLDLRELRLDIGYVLQQGALFPNLTVFENIALIPTMKKWPKAQILARAKELLPLVGLDADKYLNRYPSELSGGEAQRVGILRAFIGEPKIILMDEPFSALDPISRAQLQKLTRDMQRQFKITTVFVTHDMSEAMALADHMAIVKDGELLQVGRPNELLQHPANAFVAEFFQNFQADLSQIPLSALTENLAALSAKFTDDTPLQTVLNSLSTTSEPVISTDENSVTAHETSVSTDRNPVSTDSRKKRQEVHA